MIAERQIQQFGKLDFGPGAVLLPLCVNGTLDAVKLLLASNGACLMERTPLGVGPVTIAADFGRLDLVELFLSHSEASKELAELGDVVIHGALSKSHFDVVNRLLTKEMIKQISNGHRDGCRRFNALVTSAQYNIKAPLFLIDSGVDPVPSYRCDVQNTPFFAINETHLQFLKYLLQKYHDRFLEYMAPTPRDQGDYKTENCWGRRLRDLIFGVLQSNNDMVFSWLLSSDPILVHMDIERRLEGWTMEGSTAVDYAAAHAADRILDFFFERKLINQTSSNASGIGFYVSASNSMACLDVFERRCENLGNWLDLSAVRYSDNEDTLQFIRRLIHHGCNPNSSRGIIYPVNEAASSGSLECLKLLHSAGANLLPVTAGDSPLALACRASKKQTADWIMAKMDSEGLTLDLDGAVRVLKDCGVGCVASVAGRIIELFPILTTQDISSNSIIDYACTGPDDLRSSDASVVDFVASLLDDPRCHLLSLANNFNPISLRKCANAKQPLFMRFLIERMGDDLFEQKLIAAFKTRYAKDKAEVLKESLKVACSWGSAVLAEWLFKRGVDDIGPLEATHFAIAGAHFPCLKYLIEHYKLDLQNFTKRTDGFQFSLLALTRNLEVTLYPKSPEFASNIRSVANLLIELDPLCVNFHTRGGYSPLCQAAESGDLDLIEILLKAGARTDFEEPGQGRGLAEMLVMNARRDVLEMAFDIVGPGLFKIEHIFAALENLNFDAVNFFLDKIFPDYAKPEIEYADDPENLMVIHRLFRVGADLVPNSGLRVLSFLAARFNLPQHVPSWLLLDNRYFADVPDEDFDAYIMTGLLGSHLHRVPENPFSDGNMLDPYMDVVREAECVGEELFRRLGLLPLLVYAPIGWSAVSASLIMLKAYATVGSSVDYRNKDGKTLLMLAAPECSMEVARWLLAHGCSVHDVDYNGKSVIDYYQSASSPTAAFIRQLALA